ncbi:MAG: hypothetical protein QM504_18395 [Pseudomonadota bacterium]
MLLQFIQKTIFSTIFTVTYVLLSSSLFAAKRIPKTPILIVGASFENASTTINDDLGGPLGGTAVGFGSYLSLGDALIRSQKLNGFVINEAQAGAGSFSYPSCTKDSCSTGWWQGMDVQFEKALQRVTVRDLENPSNIINYNAEYIIIGTPNDCLHANSFGIPEIQTQPCNLKALNGLSRRQ